MAKITFAELALKTNTSIASFETNEQTVEVKQYLPIEDKMAMISSIINKSIDDNGFYNVAKVEMNMILEMVFYYTNISFTDEQKEDLPKLFDTIYSSGLWEDIYNCMNPYELQMVKSTVYNTIDKIYEYNNSVYGVLDNISKDYSNLELNAENISRKLTNADNVEFLKEVLTKMG